MIISIDVDTARNKIQQPFMIKKKIIKVSTEGTYRNIIKAVYDNPTANVNIQL